VAQEQIQTEFGISSVNSHLRCVTYKWGTRNQTQI